MSMTKSNSQQVIDAAMRTEHERRETQGRNKLAKADLEFLKASVGNTEVDLVRLASVIEQVGLDNAIDYKPLIVAYLSHPDVEVKSTALRTLVSGLGQLEYLDVALGTLHRSDYGANSDNTDDETLGAIEALTRFVGSSRPLAEDLSLVEISAQRDRVLRALVAMMVATKDRITSASLYQDLAQALLAPGSFEPMSNEAMLSFDLGALDTSFLEDFWPGQSRDNVH